jgi:hypothetical protein
MNRIITSLLLTAVLLTTGCDKKPEETPPPKSTAKLPNTKGLPATTNLYAQLDLKQDPQKKEAYGALIDSVVKAAGSKPQGREVLRKIEEVVGRLKDAGLGDFTKGDLESIVFGMTLPESPLGFVNFDPEDAEITLILRGKFSPERTKSFCQSERIPESLIEGQTAWDLGKLLAKLGGEDSLGEATGEKVVWFAFADNGTIAVGTRSALRKSLGALKGERPSLQAGLVKATEDFKDWSFYLCFNNPRLIEAAASKGKSRRPEDRMAQRLIEITPHDQAVIIGGVRGDSEAMAVILSNDQTQENIQYSVSMSKSLSSKFLKVYAESIGEIIDAAGR